MSETVSTLQVDELFLQLKDSVIMMVDDEPLLMELLQAFLEDEGYKKFITVEDSRKALDVLDVERPDILLLDLNMPHVDGFEILASVRKLKMMQQIPVIVLTSSSDAETKLKALELGATDFLSKPVDSSELALRLRNTLMVKSYQDQLTYYDTLTQLPNRKLFMDRLEWSIKKSRRDQERMALLNIGLDKFKQVNDSLGPRAGDEILTEVSRRLIDSVRESDVVSRLGVDDLWRQLARLGGDEFCILLPHVVHGDGAAFVAERIQKSLAKAFVVDGNEIYISASIGIALFPNDGEEADVLVQNAGAAAAYAKQQGVNNYAFYSKEINELSKKRLSMEAALRRALDNNEFVLHYQPKIDLQTGKVKGCEALIRWDSPEMGMVPPFKFIPIAEESGLIVPIGTWVIEEACRQQVAWRQQGLGDLIVAVNVAGPQFNMNNLQQVICSAIEAAGMNPNFLKLEITEGMMMGDEDSLIKKLNDIKSYGPSFSIDDFGTGYSSLSYLKRFPLDELKVDRSFIIDVPKAKDDSAIVKAIIAMAHSLDLNVVAEGVEELEQLEFLKGLGCNVIQGFYFSKPLPAQAFAEFVRAGVDLVSATNT
ncbi:EAL domain-containing protein [Dasania sp. GY-MA-18]|uniref:cyclic-guanylate-specific phosphodiesterase n=1 Tax=Dasania phycosphaerae TaxID=2950436 RepID=A0A9J6RHM5_9GAMM|nr:MULTISPECIES: EAL domain-containing protein [Dasania]MCR8921438.1 EAL domain-containing protein [Dasania sp. GY-MA-18]MCZ0863866.1 EAL domain-containing protein [Dasania phycosphaerae]MCZ0867594.1 EAL domain-containing protein [Dasania phycosphaerae]